MIVCDNCGEDLGIKCQHTIIKYNDIDNKKDECLTILEPKAGYQEWDQKSQTMRHFCDYNKCGLPYHLKQTQQRKFESILYCSKDKNLISQDEMIIMKINELITVFNEHIKEHK